MTAPASDVTARVAVVESHLALVANKQDDHHERLRTHGEVFVSISGKLDGISEKLGQLAGNEERLRSLEDWRTGLAGKMAVIAVLASFLAAILTALAIKVVDKAVMPSQVPPGAVSPLTPADMPVDSRGWPKYRGP
jgi:hypothetical protein